MCSDGLRHISLHKVRKLSASVWKLRALLENPESENVSSFHGARAMIDRTKGVSYADNLDPKDSELLIM